MHAMACYIVTMDYAFDDAIARFPEPVSTRLRQLRDITPSGLRDLLHVVEEQDRPVGLSVQADAPLVAWNRLLEAIPAPVRPTPSNMQHHTVRVYRDDDHAIFKDFTAILRHAQQHRATENSAADRPQSVEADIQIGMHAVRDYYASSGQSYVASYRLNDIFRIGGLPFTELEWMRRISAALPAGVRDSFACDVIRRDDGQLSIAALSLVPDMVNRQLAETVLAPIAQHYRQQRPHADIATTVLLKRHGVKLRLNHDVLEALGNSPDLKPLETRALQ